MPPKPPFDMTRMWSPARASAATAATSASRSPTQRARVPRLANTAAASQDSPRCKHKCDRRLDARRKRILHDARFIVLERGSRTARMRPCLARCRSPSIVVRMAVGWWRSHRKSSRRGRVPLLHAPAHPEKLPSASSAWPARRRRGARGDCSQRVHAVVCPICCHVKRPSTLPATHLKTPSASGSPASQPPVRRKFAPGPTSCFSTAAVPRQPVRNNQPVRGAILTK